MPPSRPCSWLPRQATGGTVEEGVVATVEGSEVDSDDVEDAFSDPETGWVAPQADVASRNTPNPSTARPRTLTVWPPYERPADPLYCRICATGPSACSPTHDGTSPDGE